MRGRRHRGRFLPPFAAAGHGRFAFGGSAQPAARPLGPPVDTLAALGTAVTAGPGGGPPVLLDSEGLDGGAVAVESPLSGQFLSGLLMAAPLTRRPLTLTVDSLVSRPCIAMTLALMRRFGAKVTERHGDVIEVQPGGHGALDLTVEPDASTASYAVAAAAVTGGTVTVPGPGHGSLQGDLRFVDVLRRLGARVDVTESATSVTGEGPLRGRLSVGMGEISDTLMTLAAIAPRADAPVTIRGIAHARLKDSDRITAIARNLRALGADTDEGHDWITVHPGTPTGARIARRRDHRIGMAFSVLGLRVPGITLDDAPCVGKSFPGFHEELRRLFPLASRPASPQRQGSR
ncbi:3-phosphoshikimate 1-carboxyvinyltransferase [Streptomyces sp. NPDC048392]|uniref:3-phosphoshikimate 1-carboxyvinyltransferase n=1 Tax=Streptomyces sp. NPDC048392 TaxID=3365543 RepID=UPI00371AA979